MPIVAQRAQPPAIRGEPDFSGCRPKAAQNVNAPLRLQFPKNDQSASNSWLFTSPSPPAGGTTSGGATYNSGQSVTVSATAGPGYGRHFRPQRRAGES